MYKIYLVIPLTCRCMKCTFANFVLALSLFLGCVNTGGEVTAQACFLLSNYHKTLSLYVSGVYCVCDSVYRGGVLHVRTKEFILHVSIQRVRVFFVQVLQGVDLYMSVGVEFCV